MRTAPPLLRFGILELGYHKESSSLSVLRPWTGTRSFDLRQKSHRDTSKICLRPQLMSVMKAPPRLQSSSLSYFASLVYESLSIRTKEK